MLLLCPGVRRKGLRIEPPPRLFFLLTFRTSLSNRHTCSACSIQKAPQHLGLATQKAEMTILGFRTERTIQIIPLFSLLQNIQSASSTRQLAELSLQCVPKAWSRRTSSHNLFNVFPCAWLCCSPYFPSLILSVYSHSLNDHIFCHLCYPRSCSIMPVQALA